MLDSVLLSKSRWLWVMGCLFFLNGCSFARCCDVDLLEVSQTTDLQSLTYTVRLTPSGNCDATGVEVEVEVPISLTSTVGPGTTSEHTHYIGRVKQGKSVSKIFIVNTAGALVRTEALKGRVSRIRDYSACSGLGS